MEQHAVPRNITGFQFHLIGDMTVKQFAYLATGTVSGYLFYRVSSLPTLMTLIISGSLALIGFSFAFLPIQERPLDKWLAAFIKSILSPTRFLWQKNNPPPEILLRPAIAQTKVFSSVNYQAQKEAREKLNAYLRTLPTPPQEVFNREEKNYIEKTMAMFSEIPVVSVSVQQDGQPVSVSSSLTPIKPAIKQTTTEKTEAPVPLETYTPVPTIIPPDTITVSRQGTSLQMKSASASFLPSQTSLPDNGQKKLADQLQKTLREKEALEQQLKKLQADLIKESSPRIVRPQEEKNEPTVYTVKPQEIKMEVGIPTLPQTPNILSGVTRDPQKKLLPNIIITIKDKSNMPLRALKTNKLGQFATATPLPNGTYFTCAEDPLKRYVFDIAQITLSGKAISPIEIIAKGQKELLREKLSKELFGGNVNI